MDFIAEAPKGKRFCIILYVINSLFLDSQMKLTLEATAEGPTSMGDCVKYIEGLDNKTQSVLVEIKDSLFSLFALTLTSLTHCLNIFYKSSISALTSLIKGCLTREQYVPVESHVLPMP